MFRDSLVPVAPEGYPENPKSKYPEGTDDCDPGEVSHCAEFIVGVALAVAPIPG